MVVRGESGGTEDVYLVTYVSHVLACVECFKSGIVMCIVVISQILYRKWDVLTVV